MITVLINFFEKRVFSDLLRRNLGKCRSRDPGHCTDLFHHRGRHFAVHVQDHDCLLAGVDPADLHARDVDIVLAKDGRGTADDTRLVVVPGDDHVSLGDHVHGIAADRNDPAPALEKDGAADGLLALVGLDLDRDEVLEPAGLLRHGLAHRDAAFLCNEIRVDDIDRLLENRIEKSLEGKTGDILHTARIRRKFPAVDKLNG